MNKSESANELYGVKLDAHTGTHGPCQVTPCAREWTFAGTVGKGDDARDLALCSAHVRMFREISNLTVTARERYQDLLTEER